MKKVLAAIILLIYFAVSTGFTLSIHYCMDKFSSAEIGASDNHKCGKCGMDVNGGCCRDVVKLVKLQNSYFSQKAISPDFQLPPVTVQETAHLITPLFNFPHTKRAVAHAPPLPQQEIYIANNVF